MNNKFRGLTVILVLMFSFSLNAGGPVSGIVINEVDYDQSSTDDEEFVELYNNGAVAIDLTGYTLELVNGSGGAVYDTINLPSLSLAAGAYFVICANNSTVANCDLDDGPNTNWLQNGAPDGMRLLNSTPVVVDAFSYEGNTAGATEGTGAGNDSTIRGLGLSRSPNGVDTDNNSVDFSVLDISPGAANFEPLAASITATTNVTINGESTGSATAAGSNGVAPYTYSWSDGQTTATATNLAAGTYTVTVTDSSIVSTANKASTAVMVTITEPTVLVTAVSGTDETAFGAADGTATVIASGGIPGYTYLWSNGATTATITGLMSGTYTVTVTDNNGFGASTMSGPVVVAAALPPAIIPTLNQYMVMLLMLLMGLVVSRRIKA